MDGARAVGGRPARRWPVTTVVLVAILCVAGLATAPPPPAEAQTSDPESITLGGTVRDFRMGTPRDFECPCGGSDRGIVKPDLGADGKPVYSQDPPGTTPTTSGRANFDTWYRDVEGVNLPIPLDLELERVPGSSPSRYRYSNGRFFPINGQGFGNEGHGVNFSFSYELHTEFTYQGGEQFSFVGDDDVFVFINKRLAIDLGGIHPSAGAAVNLDAFAAANGMMPGNTYQLDLFFAERHTGASSFSMETTLKLREPDPGPPVTAAAGPDQTISEGSTVTLDGSASRALDPTASVGHQWDLVSTEGPPVQLSSTKDPRPSFPVFDDGRYRFRLTVSAGEHTASDEVDVVVQNAVPAIARVESDATATDGLAQVTVAFTDSGIFDRHGVTYDWGDGSAPEVVPAAVDGTGWGYGFAGHRYATTGPKTVTVTVADGNGGISEPRTIVVDVGAAGRGEIPTGPGAALWATSPSANDTIRVSGSNNFFEGRVHSNGEIRVSGSHHRFTGGTEHVRGVQVSGSDTVFVPAATASSVQPPPFTYDLPTWAPGTPRALSLGAAYRDMSSQCSGGGGNRTWRPTNVLAAGVYYASCNIHVSGSNAGGNVTFVATGTIKVSGSTSSWTPYADGLLFLSGATDARAIDISGSGHQYHGAMFAGSGGVELTGSGNTLDCGVVGTTTRVSGSHNRIGGANCVGGGGTGTRVSIGAPPLLVPTLSHELVVDKADVVPGDQLTYTDTIHNGRTGTGGIGGGAQLFMPVELGVDNPTPNPVTLAGVAYALEIHDPVTGTWSTLATTDPAAPPALRIVTLAARPNPTTGVTYPTTGNLVDGTVVPGGSLASWSGVYQVQLTPEQVGMLMDPARVDAIRNTAELTTSTIGVRKIARFDDAPLESLRAAPGGDLTHAQAVMTTATNGSVVLTDPAVPSFATIPPGAAATGSTTITVPTPAPRSPDETDAAYVARLQALDGSLLSAGAYVKATAGIGDVWATQQTAATRRHLPVVSATVSAAGWVPAGTAATWTVVLRNTGSVAAEQLDLSGALAAGGTVAVTAVPASLAPGETATVTATAATPGASGQHQASFAVRWASSGGAAGTYGPVGGKAAVRWSVATQPVAIGRVDGNFYPLAATATTFTATPADTPAFARAFPNIAFNPPAGIVAGNTFSVDPSTVPFTDVTTGVDGVATGTIPAEGSGNAAGAGSLVDFQAVLSGSIAVTVPGRQVFTVIADDGFVLGIGGGATRVAGPTEMTPAVTPFHNHPVMGGHNRPGTLASYSITVDFPAPGQYPFEIDYLNKAGPASLVFATATSEGDLETLEIPANANIFGAGRTVAPSPAGDFYPPGPALPAQAPFPLTPGAAITFPGTSGDTTAYGGCGGPHSTADGVSFQNTDVLSWDGIAGIIDPSRQQFLTGVFLGDDEPHGNPPVTTAPPAPPRLQYTDQQPTPAGYLSHDEAEYAPGLQQVFFIGDGRRAAGDLQRFVVPAGATRLFLGMADSYGFHGYPGAYGDNCGQFTITGQNGTITPIPPLVALSLSPTTSTASTGTRHGPVARAVAADGNPVAGIPVGGAVTGANPGFPSGITGADGSVTLDYVGTQPGTDRIDATSSIVGSATVSNQVQIAWTGAPTPEEDPDRPGPTADGCSPASDATVTAPTPFACTLTPRPDTTVTDWTVTARPAGGAPEPGDTITLGTGTGPSVLTTVDPTKLANGIWIVTVIARASDGGRSATETPLIVDGRLKLGQYHVTYQDLEVPVAGIPIQVNRTYDTLDRLQEGDFGHGWNLEIADFKVQTNRPLGRGPWTKKDECIPYPQFGVMHWLPCFENPNPRYVTVTWPDGRTETFDFVAPTTNFFPNIATAEYKGRRGTTSRLEPAPGDATYAQFGGDFYTDFFSPDTLYDPERFVLTGRDGSRYLLDVHEGLVEMTNTAGNTLTFDESGIHSSEGPDVTFERDAAGRIEAIVDPAGLRTTYTYDAGGDLRSVADAEVTTSYSYSDDHFLAEERGRAPRSRMEYEDGRLVRLIDAAGRVTPLSVVVDARTETAVSADGRVTTIVTYDERGNPTDETVVADGVVDARHTEYDDGDRITLERGNDGRTAEYRYSDAGDIVWSKAPDGTITEASYDTRGAITAVSVNGAQQGTRSYNARGQLERQSLAGGGELSMSYDADGILTAMTDAAGRTTSIGYDGNGYVGSVTNANGTITYGNDDSGRVVRITDPHGTVNFGLDAAGRIRSVRDVRGTEQRWSYNAFGLVTEAVDRRGKSTTYRYDDLGQLVEKQDRTGQTTTYTWTADGQMASRTSAAGTSSFSYDASGQLTHAENQDAVIDFGYDDQGNLTSQRSRGTATSSQPDVTLGATFDGEGNRIGLASPGHTTSFDHDVFGRITTVQDSGAGRMAFRYASGGYVDRFERPNGVIDTVQRNTNFEILDRRTSGPSGLVASAAYAYDDRGLRSSMTDAAGVHSYSYDDRKRLTGVAHAGSGQPSESYSYDAVGNRLSDPHNPVGTVAFDGGDRLQRDNRFDYTWDDEGRLAEKRERATGVTTSYTWATGGQLARVATSDGRMWTFRYDALGRRIELADGTTATRYAYDGENVRQVFDGSNALVATYTLAQGYDSVLARTAADGTVTYPVVDALGTTVAVTDAAGSVTQSFRYDVWGNPLAGSASPDGPYGFTGLTADPTGLLFARARYYDPSVGRFLSEDPALGDNGYVWAEDNPISYRDPSGMVILVERSMEESETVKKKCATKALGDWAAEMVVDQVIALASGSVNPFDLDPNARGHAIEDLHFKDGGSRFGGFNQPTWDAFDGKKATSIKSIDTSTEFYTQRPSKILERLKQALKEAHNFGGSGPGNKVTFPASKIKSKELVVYINKTPTQGQENALKKTKACGRVMGITIQIIQVVA